MTATTTKAPARIPITIELPTVTMLQGAVIATRPARVPLRIMLRSGFPSRSWVTTAAEMQPAAAAMLVLRAIEAIALASTAIVLPGLNPNHPSHKTRHPRVAEVMLWPGIGLTL